MFNFKDLGDMSKLAQQAKALQSKQEQYQSEVLGLLRDIRREIDDLKRQINI